MDEYRIDSHKLNYHPMRVADWMNGKLIYPVYVEISPSGACNHRCIFCSVDFMGYKNIVLESRILKERISEMAVLGVKSIMFAGEGEPLLHKDLPDIMSHTKKAGIDIGLTTNGVLLKPEKCQQIMAASEWIKISCNAGTRETYSKIHKTKPNDFDTVIDNLKAAVDIRKEKQLNCTLGIQILHIPENSSELEDLVKIAKKIGVDYLVVKPYTVHPENRHRVDIQYQDHDLIYDRLEQHGTHDFNVVIRRQAMGQWDGQIRKYGKCHALPFWSYIDSSGNVWGCSSYLRQEYFHYGNILTQTFQNIWEGEKRKKSLENFDQGFFDLKNCKYNCRMDKINQYLWELKCPPRHVNFI